MIFTETTIAGAFLVDPEPIEDTRGLFVRTFCEREFAARGLSTGFVQCSTSFNRVRGTVRGMHYQVAPACETKLVRCTAGALYDVIVDLRPESPSYGRHVAVELTATNRRALYIPEMCAHGFQALVDATEVCYQISAFWAPECGAGVRFDDPALGIEWPLPPTLVSDRDRTWPLLPNAGHVSHGARR